MKEHKKSRDFKLLELYINCPKYYNYFIDGPKMFKSDIDHDYLRKALYSVLMNISNKTPKLIEHDLNIKFNKLTKQQRSTINKFSIRIINKHADDEIKLIGVKYPIVIGTTPFELQYDLLIRDQFKGKFHFYYFNFNKSQFNLDSGFSSPRFISLVYHLLITEEIPMDMIKLNMFDFYNTPHLSEIKLSISHIQHEFNQIVNIQKGMREGIIYRRPGKYCDNCPYNLDC